MKKLTNEELKKLQKIELEMLIELDRICRKYDIKYSLVGGTLIGAIRHNGFIPWDDDIDVAMLRKDYEKFKIVCEKELDKNKYYFQDMTTDKDYTMYFGKIRRKNSIYAETSLSLDENRQGIWVDIFPADNISNNKLIQKYSIIKTTGYKMMLFYKTGSNPLATTKFGNIILKMYKLLSKFKSIENIKNKLENYCNKYDSKKTKYVVCYGGVRNFKEIIPRYYLENLMEHKFEGHNFYIPKDFDTYLKHFYDDYMTLPPIEQRKTHPVESKL